MTKIEWTRGDDGSKGATWNPIVGCTKVSTGCKNCYAERMSGRIANMAIADERKGKNPGIKKHYRDVTRLNPETGLHLMQFNNEVVCVEEALAKPLRWKKPRLVFVNSMSDLFHEGVPFEFIDKVFAVMAICPQHTFQILTKRPERMAEYLEDNGYSLKNGMCLRDRLEILIGQIRYRNGMGAGIDDGEVFGGMICAGYWPLPNLWLGTSVEDQTSADERIPHLLRCPAAVRFLSCEPLISGVDLGSIKFAYRQNEDDRYYSVIHPLRGIRQIWEYDRAFDIPDRNVECHSIDWVIAGGESGPGARPCNVDWIRGIVRQCKDAGVACFVKQLGAKPYDPSWHGDGTPYGSRMVLNDPKGGNPDEWPEDLRVREMPEQSKGVT